MRVDDTRKAESSGFPWLKIALVAVFNAFGIALGIAALGPKTHSTAAVLLGGTAVTDALLLYRWRARVAIRRGSTASPGILYSSYLPALAFGAIWMVVSVLFVYLDLSAHEVGRAVLHGGVFLLAGLAFGRARMLARRRSGEGRRENGEEADTTKR